MNEIFLQKKNLRKEMKMIREGVKGDFRALKEKTIIEKLIDALEDEDIKECDNILSFNPFGSEVGISPFNDFILNSDRRYKLYLPRVMGEKMEFFHISDNTKMTCSKYGILEPEPIEGLRWKGGKSFMIMPGLAFTEDGKRLGYGGGFYDKFLADNKETSIITCGVLFEEQLVDMLPVSDNDFICEKLIIG
ncbi:MAG: 5-formyltetrahydrofolate cyclo-ligase [Lachnospiraceae bacterium]|nr:5-formyltetrahydrofolate cyclo-ligase [Lachnospiraceae bacterium]